MSDKSISEESWEGDISSLLGSMPVIDPPSGFIDSAIDHRPLFAGRISLGLAALVVVALGGVVTLDMFGPRSVSPELATMSQQHEMVASGLFSGLVSQQETVFERVEVDNPLTPVTLPSEFDRAGDFVASSLNQAAYGSGDSTVSVFSETGTVNWLSLPDGNLIELNGFQAWQSSTSEVVVVQAGSAVVTIVGLDPQAVSRLLGDVDDGGGGITRSLSRMANGLTSSLGFPDQ